MRSRRTFSVLEKIPSYYAPAARYLDAQGDSTRVLIEPGDDFADYDWGNTIDPVWPGIMTRPEMLREQLIQGSYPTADLLSGVRSHAPAGHLRAARRLAPIARLFSAGDVVLQSESRLLALQHAPATGNLGAVRPAPARYRQAARVRSARAERGSRCASASSTRKPSPLPAEPPWPPPIAVFPVSDARPIYRAEPAAAPLVIDGSGAGVVAAAAAGLLADNPTIFYAGTARRIPSSCREASPTGAELVLTDSNRKELERWSSVRDNIGETLPGWPSRPCRIRPGRAPSGLQPYQPGGQSVALYGEAHYVPASAYGNPVAFTPEDRPAEAFDDNLERPGAWPPSRTPLGTGSRSASTTPSPRTTRTSSRCSARPSTAGSQR